MHKKLNKMAAQDNITLEGGGRSCSTLGCFKYDSYFKFQ